MALNRSFVHRSVVPAASLFALAVATAGCEAVFTPPQRLRAFAVSAVGATLGALGTFSGVGLFLGSSEGGNVAHEKIVAGSTTLGASLVIGAFSVWGL